MQCPSCGLQIDQPNLDRCPRCGYQFATTSEQPSHYNPYNPYPPSAPQDPSAGSGAPQNPPPYNPYGQYGGYAPPSGYGQPAPPSGYGQPAPPSGYGQPAPPSGYGQPYGYGQAAPPSYPMTPGYAPSGYPQGPMAPLPERKKSRTGLIVGIVVAVVVLLAACGGGTVWAVRTLGQSAITNLSGTPTVSASSTQTTTSATATPNETAIYGESFASNADGWAQDPGSCFLDKDGYHIKDGYICYAPIGDQSDVSISVTVQQVKGPTTWPYGIVFRDTADHADYQFMIDSNSKWVFFKCSSDNCANTIDYTGNSSIHGGLHTTNTLKVTAVGSHFEFFVNDTRVGTFDDSAYTSGGVGIGVGNNVEAVFTDFIVSRPN